MNEEILNIMMDFLDLKSEYPDFEIVSKTFAISIEDLCDILYDGSNKIERINEGGYARSVRYNSYTEKVILSYYDDNEGWSLQINEVGGRKIVQVND